MLLITKDALKDALRAIFPIAEVPQLHEGGVPVGFTRPALYIHMIPWSPQHITTDIHSFRARWQVVYFPREDAVGNAIPADLYQAAARLELSLGREHSLPAEGGRVLHLTDFSLDVRDDVVYASLALTGYLRREEPAAALLGKAELSINTEEDKT